jgi:hypothetical protein
VGRRVGRLDVTYENRVVFRHLIPRATIGAGRAFMERYYKRSYSRLARKPLPPERTRVPADCFGDPFLVRWLHASLRSADGEIIDVL